MQNYGCQPFFHFFPPFLLTIEVSALAFGGLPPSL
jgi:hypothetical protein